MANTKFVIVTGGMISGVGKGVAAASIGKILSEYGYSTTLIKIDPYLNCDAGTLRPTEHGEVWVTADGGEIDQDLGTYERFLGINIPKKNSITTGQIYKSVIDRERKGEYLGQTVQFIPHIIDEIIARIEQAAKNFECAVIEIGGTLGDDENKPFLLTSKLLMRKYGANSVASVLVSYLPVPDHVGEMKTKPTQLAARILSEQGVFPDFIVCRSKEPLDDIRKHKIELSVHVPGSNLIAAPDTYPVYNMPLLFEQQGFGLKLLKHFNLPLRKKVDWSVWQERVTAMVGYGNREICIGMVGKYTQTGTFSFTDSYVSIYHALMHAAAARGVRVSIISIDANAITTDTVKSMLTGLHGIVVPGGFGTSGIEGKLAAITYARTTGLAYLGICYGMQLAAVEFARNVCQLPYAHTIEVDPDTVDPIITILPDQREQLADNKYGGTMRLGAYEADVKEGSLMHELYGSSRIIERHRHRYEVNPHYVPLLEKAGMCFSATHLRDDGTLLMESLEITGHPYFVATQAHPEFMSRIEKPHPLFLGLVDAALIMVGLEDKDPKTYNAGLCNKESQGNCID